jgi:integrase/recombinase XerD
MNLTTIDTVNALDAVKPAATYLASLRTVTGRRSMISALNTIARVMGAADYAALDWRRINTDAAKFITAKLNDTGAAPATINKALSALRGVADELFDSGDINGDERTRIRNATKTVKGSRLAAGRNIEPWELIELMRTCAADKSPAGRRDAALIALAAKTGARRDELAKIEIADLHPVEDGCFSIRVIGKGNKERTLYCDNGACAALKAWLTVRGDMPGALFCPINKGGSMKAGASMTTTAVHGVLVKRVGEAGLSDVSWHDFRRTFAGAALDAGEDLSKVAKAMGHSDVRTTTRYDVRPERELRKTFSRVSVPFFGT